MSTLKYDLVIVGAGPAGSSAAKAASEEGISVLVLEKKASIGRPVQCGEFVPKALCREVDIDERCIAQEVDIMRTYMPDGEIIETSSPGFILDRALFDEQLVLEAAKAGAHILLRTKAISIYGRKVIARPVWRQAGCDGEEINIETKVVIGADGPISTVGGWIGQVNREFVRCLQYEIPLTRGIETTGVYFDLRYRAGYGWLFPKGERANVGVGIRVKSQKSGVRSGGTKDEGRALKEALEHLVSRLERDGNIERSILRVSGGLVPVGGYLRRTWGGNILLVGDAAGQTDPISGTGILSAILCGKIAGRIAAMSIKRNDLEILGEYEVEWKDILQKPLNRALRRRRFLDTHWPCPPSLNSSTDNGEKELSQLLRENWAAFRSYYRET
ncbi:MAG: geranylgeranyl reductase family protein [Actinomycetota bacterium]|nr:geranylgeranyl reductase family protein [Actinomycetota bacterium]